MTSTGHGKDDQLAIGIDVSRDTLDAHRLPDGATKRFPNDTASHKALIRWIKATPVDLIVFEATGSYARAIELALTGAGLPAVKATRVRRAALSKPSGRLPKPMRSTPPCWPAFPASAT